MLFPVNLQIYYAQKPHKSQGFLPLLSLRVVQFVDDYSSSLSSSPLNNCSFLTMIRRVSFSKSACARAKKGRQTAINIALHRSQCPGLNGTLPRTVFTSPRSCATCNSVT